MEWRQAGMDSGGRREEKPSPRPPSMGGKGRNHSKSRILDLDKEKVLEGIIFSEILAGPRIKRKQR